MAAREPYITSHQKNESDVLVTVAAKGLVPNNQDPHLAKNGTAGVTFSKQSFVTTIDVQEDKKTRTLWKYKAHRLPSQIEPNQCEWRVEKDQVVITLIKKKEKVEGKAEGYVDWMPFLRLKGLDQYDSSEDEEGNVPDPAPFKLKSEDLDFEVEHGKSNVFYVNKS